MENKTSNPIAITDTMSTDFASILREIATSAESQEADKVLKKILEKARKAAFKGKFSIIYRWADYATYEKIAHLGGHRYHHKNTVKKDVALVSKLLSMKFKLSLPYTEPGDGHFLRLFGFYEIVISWTDENVNVA